jgi:hypothetical protein
MLVSAQCEVVASTQYADPSISLLPVTAPPSPPRNSRTEECASAPMGQMGCGDSRQFRVLSSVNSIIISTASLDQIPVSQTISLFFFFFFFFFFSFFFSFFFAQETRNFFFGTNEAQGWHTLRLSLGSCLSVLHCGFFSVGEIKNITIFVSSLYEAPHCPRDKTPKLAIYLFLEF